MARVDASSLDWDHPVQAAGGDWATQLVRHWEVILEAFAPYEGDPLVERAIVSCQELMDEKPEPATAEEANMRFRKVRDFARAQAGAARQRQKQQEAATRRRQAGSARTWFLIVLAYAGVMYLMIVGGKDLVTVSMDTRAVCDMTSLACSRACVPEKP